MPGDSFAVAGDRLFLVRCVGGYIIVYMSYHDTAIVGIIVSPVRSTYGGYYGLVVVTPRPRPQTLHRSHDNLKNPYRIASIFYM